VSGNKVVLNYFRSRWQRLRADQKFSDILGGTAWVLIAQVGAVMLGLAITVLMARFYGPAVMGVVAVLHSFLSLAAIFTVLGTSSSILRLIPEHLVKHSVSSAFRVYRRTQWLVTAVSLFSTAAFFLAAPLIAGRLFGKPHLAYYFALASLFIVFYSLLNLNTQALRGLRLIRTYAFMHLLPRLNKLLLLLPLTFFFNHPDRPVQAYLGSVLLTALAGILIMDRAFKKRLSPGQAVQKVSSRELLFISLPMLLTQAMNFVTTQTGVLLLAVFRPEAEVGRYSVAVALAALTSFVLRAINSMATPKLSELFHGDKLDDLFHVARRSAQLIFWSTAPILLGLVVLGRFLLAGLYGPDFAAAFPAMLILVSGQFVHSVSGLTGSFMNMTGEQMVLSRVKTVAALANLGLGLLLIPAMGMLGAALAAAFCNAAWNLYVLYWIRKKYGRSIAYLPLGRFFRRK